MLSIRQGLADGTIDAIASDHAPHTVNEKDIEFDKAAFGVIGLETELAAAITQLLYPGMLDWPGIVEKLCLNPARILKIDRGTLGVGRQADIIVVSPHEQWLAEKSSFFSKSKNSCFLDKTLTGLVSQTIYKGKVIYSSQDKGVTQRVTAR
jgi:dihydroorotase